MSDIDILWNVHISASLLLVPMCIHAFYGISVSYFLFWAPPCYNWWTPVGLGTKFENPCLEVTVYKERSDAWPHMNLLLSEHILCLKNIQKCSFELNLPLCGVLDKSWFECWTFVRSLSKPGWCESVCLLNFNLQDQPICLFLSLWSCVLRSAGKYGNVVSHVLTSCWLKWSFELIAYWRSWWEMSCWQNSSSKFFNLHLSESGFHSKFEVILINVKFVSSGFLLFNLFKWIKYDL